MVVSGASCSRIQIIFEIAIASACPGDGLDGGFAQGGTAKVCMEHNPRTVHEGLKRGRTNLLNSVENSRYNPVLIQVSLLNQKGVATRFQAMTNGIQLFPNPLGRQMPRDSLEGRGDCRVTKQSVDSGDLLKQCLIDVFSHGRTVMSLRSCV